MKKRTPFVPEFSSTIDLGRQTSHEWVESTAPFIHQHDKVQFLGTTISKKKITILFYAMMAVLLMFLVRSASLQIFSGKGLAALAFQNKVKTVTVSARRGVIYDRNGIALVQNIPRFVLQVNPAEFMSAKEKRQETLSILENITGISGVQIQKNIRAHTVADPLILMDEVEYDDALRIIAKTALLPGVEVILRDRRNYLFGTGTSLSHVIGHMGVISKEEYVRKSDRYLPSDSIGKDGIEAYYEDQLRGQDGKKEIEVDAIGVQKRIVSEDVARDGRSIMLSIDKDLQDIAEESLKKIIEKFKTTRGVALVSNPNTGELLAYVSLPSFDNNLFSKKISQDTYTALFQNADKPLYNRPIQGEYPAGSTIKPLVASAALQEGLIAPTTSFLSSGGIQVSKWFFPDWKEGGHGRTNLAKALAESVNTYFYIIAGGYRDFTGLGQERLLAYYRRFGIDSKTGIDLPGEHTGFVPSPKWKKEKTGEPWYIGDTYHVAIGQGDVLVTPIQIHAITAYFANGGWAAVPRLFRSYYPSSEIITSNTPREYFLKDIIDADHVRHIRDGLRQTVLAGSGRRLLSLPVSSAGKTGTAQWKNGARPHAWFTGWAPFEDPQLVVTVLVEEGEEGSRSAIAVADDIFRWYFSKRNNGQNAGKLDTQQDGVDKK